MAGCRAKLPGLSARIFVGVSWRRQDYPDRGLESAYMDPSRFARLRFSIGIRLRAYIRLLIRGIYMAPATM